MLLAFLVLLLRKGLLFTENPLSFIREIYGDYARKAKQVDQRSAGAVSA